MLHLNMALLSCLSLHLEKILKRVLKVISYYLELFYVFPPKTALSCSNRVILGQMISSVERNFEGV